MSLSNSTVLVLAVLLLGIALPSTRTARAKSPNVLIILADDCTFSDLSIYGGPNAKTPNIERLASPGLTFNRAYGIRSVRDERFRYILNLTHDVVFQNAATKDPTFKTWQRLAAAGDARAKRLVRNYQHRPAEELYDCDAEACFFC